MKRKTWRKYHKWLGIFTSFFLVMFCLSGIVLNHRRFFADVNVSRSLLPDRYAFKQWNNGLLRGTLRCKDDLICKCKSSTFRTNAEKKQAGNTADLVLIL